MRRDRRKDAVLRAIDHTVLRYSDEQVEYHAAAVGEEIANQLSRPAQSA